jgi:hypothetical protein
MSNTKESKRRAGRRARKTPPRDYAIGFCKPPREHQFKPGNNANPRGRPKDTSKPKLLIKELLLELIPARQGDVVKTMSKLEAIITQTINDALKGDHKSRLTVIAMGREVGLLTPKEAPEHAADQNLAARLDAAIARLAEEEEAKRQSADPDSAQRGGPPHGRRK